MFSRRTRWDAPENRLAIARRQHRDTLLDLTESNPTRAAIVYPIEEIADIFGRAARAAYSPDPRGLRSAREALAEWLACSPDDLIVTASTSEAYAFLFKLLCDPGDEVLTPTPSYPLLEHLSQLENVEQRTFPLQFHKRWELDTGSIHTTPRTRAIIVVNPNNPTGSFVSTGEQESLARIGLPVISDEVFLDYRLDGRGVSFVRDEALTFALGGLSKLAGLPHLKLAWIRVSGPAREKRDALAALELISDSFLSVATPVQIALPELLAIAPQIRDAISARTRENLDLLAVTMASNPALRLLPVEGGWSAVIRIPHVEPDEDLAVRLVEDHDVGVHPGYFFDFDHDGYLVVSLLTRPEIFREGIARMAAALPR